MKALVRAYIIQHLLGGREIGDDDELLLGGLVDSLGVMRLVGYLEQECGIAIPPQDVTIENFATIATIANYLEQRAGT